MFIFSPCKKVCEADNKNKAKGINLEGILNKSLNQKKIIIKTVGLTFYTR